MSTQPTAPSPRPGRRRNPDLWLGVLVACVVCLGTPALALVGPGALSLMLVGVPAVFVVGVVLAVPERSRWWGVGLLIGFFVSLVVGAGACVAILSGVGG